MRRLLISAALLSAAFAAPAIASQVVMTFEGVGDQVPVGSFYSGLGITFSGNALGIIDSDVGGSGNFGGEPSPSTCFFWLSGADSVMDVSNGFQGYFGLWYTAINNPGSVTLFDGPGGTGNALGTLNLPVTLSDGGDPTGAFSPFVYVDLTFSGTCYSVDFGGTENQIGFDNVTLGAVPEPASALMLSASGLLLRRRRAR
jgi:hypothetical protein